MNLKRRLALGSAVSILVMCVIAVVAWTLLRSMEYSVLSVTEEYTELQDIDTARSAFSDARAAVTAEPLRVAEAIAALDRAEAVLGSFVSLQETHAGADEEHHAEEAEIGVSLTTGIERLRARLRAHGSVAAGPEAALRADAVTAIDELRLDLNALALTANALVSDALETTRRQLNFAVTALIACCVVGAVVVVILAVLQHRWVVLPISTLRRRVRQTLAARSAPGADDPSADMLGDLDRDFGGLVRELEGLYGTLEERVEAKSRELVQSERLASVGYLAAGVAHEINNPLNTILGYTELSLRELAENGNGTPVNRTTSADSLRVIRDETMRCKHIVEKLLSLVRKSDAPREAVDLGAVIEEVVSMVERLKQFRCCTLRTVLPGGPRRFVFAREAEMKQILLNLIVNALDATAPDDGCVTIELEPDGERLRFHVRDNGFGMSQGTIERVFEPFFSAKRSVGAPGTGLGLSIVHAIVHDHGGTIEAKSEGPGQGSVFTVSLPAMPKTEVAHVE